MKAWKEKMAADRERKQKELESAGGTRGLLEEIDKKASTAPAIASPQSPDVRNGDVTPVPYAGKFDPKAIVKKATASSAGATTTLGKDVPLPQITKASATLTSSVTGSKADNKVVAASASTAGGFPPVLNS